MRALKTQIMVHLAGAFLVLGLVSCSGESSGTAPSPTPATAAAPVPAEPAQKPAEARAPSPPDPIQAALDDSRYDVVCAALVEQGFSESICNYIAARARGDRGSFRERALRSFFRDQHVRRLHGRIVDVFRTDATSITYEVRAGGRTTLLETSDTAFTTTGGFSMWAQRMPDDEEVVMMSGRVREVPVYVEWKLADDILDLARHRRGNEETAEMLLQNLVDDWVVTWRHEDTVARLEEERRTREAHDQAAATPSEASAAGPEESTRTR